LRFEEGEEDGDGEDAGRIEVSSGDIVVAMVQD